MKMWLVLAITWVWWAGIVGPAAWVCSSSLSLTEGGHNNAPSVNTVEFHVTGCTKESYNIFLRTLRKQLSSGASVYNISLLPAQSGSQQDLLLVKLFDWDDTPITLVLNRTNAYVIAYEAKNIYYLLHDTPNNTTLYGSTPHRFTFTGSYSDLQRVADENREKIDLGITALARAIYTLYYWSPPQLESSVARSLIVLIQSVSETARFKTIELRVTNNIIYTGTTIRYDNFRPGVGVIDLETNWETLSTSVQQSKDGVFSKPVKLKVNFTTTMDITTVTTAQKFCGLALLLRLRQSQTSLSPHDSSVLSTSVDLNIRSMLDIAA